MDLSMSPSLSWATESCINAVSKLATLPISSSEEFEEKFWRSKSAETFYNSLPNKLDDPMASLFKESMQSLLKSKSKSNLMERMGGMLEVGIEKQMSKIEKGFTFLATVGSTAPFIGLFGTVWGIMNSFQSIAISRKSHHSTTQGNVLLRMDKCEGGKAP